MSANDINNIVTALNKICDILTIQNQPSVPTKMPSESARAFVWESDGFRPVYRPAIVDPNLFTGIERQMQAFYDNVNRFLQGLPAHEVLLWGERGTGKSSLVRSLLVAFREENLALLEIPESYTQDLPTILNILENDPRHWILYLDDFTFQHSGDHYRELKVLLEGGLEAKPLNTLTVATSNRRHLMREAFPADDEIHPEETTAETMSLADRFGLSLSFYSFDQDTYLAAVARHLEALGASPPVGWEESAIMWAMTRGLRSGRVARQAACELVGKMRLS
jgi:predicted AAA+ superfamily ATPase